MPRFESKEEYARWRASQRGEAAPAPSANPEVSAASEQVYDGPAPGSQEFHDRRLEHAGLATEREKNMAMLCHLAAFAGFLIPFGNIIGPVIVWMMGKAESDFVNEHGKASVNFQMSLSIFFVISTVLILLIGPIAIAIIAGLVLYAVVMIIVNSVKAHNGEEGGYTLTIQFLS